MNKGIVKNEEKLYRVDKNKFALFYDAKDDDLSINFKGALPLSFKDLKDLKSLTTDLINIVENGESNS